MPMKPKNQCNKTAFSSGTNPSRCRKSGNSCLISGETLPLETIDKRWFLRFTLIVSLNIGAAFESPAVHDGQDRAANVHDSPAPEVA